MNLVGFVHLCIFHSNSIHSLNVKVIFCSECTNTFSMVAFQNSSSNSTKCAIDTLLRNEKYIVNVLVGKTYCNDFPCNERRGKSLL